MRFYTLLLIGCVVNLKIKSVLTINSVVTHPINWLVVNLKFKYVLKINSVVTQDANAKAI